MPPTQLNNKRQMRERPTFNDMLWEQLQDTKTEVRETRKELSARMDKLDAKIDDTRQELNSRMDKLEQRMDNFDAKLDETRKELSNKIDALHNEIKSSTGHISIANISTVGIALGVLYSLIFK